MKFYNLLSALVVLHTMLLEAALLEEKSTYWLTQRKGANCFNSVCSAEWFAAACDRGIEFIRLAPDKWQGEGIDFLLGDADSFKELSFHDVQMLKQVLNEAEEQGVKVVITLLSLPGLRWRQKNNQKDDLRLWSCDQYKSQALQFWRSLASCLKGHPALVGYNIINEPRPELLTGNDDYKSIDFKQWYDSIKGSLADLNLFYRDSIAAIREVDISTPIIIDTGLCASPWAISSMVPQEDKNVLYSFHMYEPYEYTNASINKGRFSYPGPLEEFQNTVVWDKKRLEQFFLPVVEWQAVHQVPSRQILVGEFGCNRLSKGAAQYLGDLIAFFDEQSWHWAFYAFREDTWGGMDYELGNELPASLCWEKLERGESLDTLRKDNDLFDVIKKALVRRSL